MNEGFFSSWGGGGYKYRVSGMFFDDEFFTNVFGFLPIIS
jgi:hypothetical protein